MPDPANNAQQGLTLDTASQARSLDDLAGVAARMEAPAGAGPDGASAAAPGAGAPVAQNPLALANATVIESALQAGLKGFCGFTKLNAPRAILTPSTVNDLATEWGKWCASRNIDLKAYMGKHSDTIPLALSTAVLAWSVYEATKAEIAARKPVDTTAKPAGEGGAGEGAAVA